MANLKNRINRLTKLRGPVEQKGINSLDLFLVGALAGLYSKRLIIENVDQGTSRNFDPKPPHPTQNQTLTDVDLSAPQSGEYAEKLKSISTTDRLSNSVSDYILKVEKQGYSDYAKGFYTSQVDNIAKVFATSSETASLTDIAKREIASLKEQRTQPEQVVQTEEEINERTSIQSARKNFEQEDESIDIEKATGNDTKEPTYQEILETFRDELEKNLEDEKSVQKEVDPDVVKTAELGSDLNFSEEPGSTKKEDGSNAVDDGSGSEELKSEEKIELAQAESPGVEKEVPSQASPATGAEATGAATGPTSIFGSVAMVPVAAVGLQKVVSEIREIVDGGDSPTVSPVQPTIPVETNPESESPSEDVPVVEESVIIPSSGGGGESAIAAAPEPILAFQGRVVDGYVVGATVFYDENNNGILDDSESNYVGVTDADGNFQLPDFSAAAQGGSIVVLPGGVDINTGHKIGAMQVNVPKDADGNPILSDPDSPDAQAAISSPLTLILAQNSDIVEADLIAQLGMTGVEEKGLAFYDPVSEMQAGNNNSLAEYVFTIQQQLFSIIQAGSKIAGEAAGLSALEVSVQAVGDAMKTALENGTALTIDGITTSAITSVANGSGFSSLASGFASIVQTTNQKIAEGYSGMALALSDPSNEDSISLLSNARATAAASQDTLLSTIETSLSSNSLDTTAFGTTLNSVIAENSAVFGTVLQAEVGDGSSGLSEFGNPAFIVTKLLEQTGTATRDIVDLSSSINTLSLEQLSQLGVSHVRLLGSNTAVEISMGNVTNTILAALNDDATVDDVNTTLVDESSVDDGLFASNYTVTLKVTDAQVATVVANATTLNAAGIDVIKPVEGTLSLTLSQVRELQTLGFEFASGLVRFSATSADSLTFDEIYALLNSGLKLTDASEVSVSIPDGDSRSTFATIKDLASRGVSFDGGTITLTQDDLKGSFNVLQAQLLDAAKSNIVFDTDSVSSWSLGKAADGTSLGNPKLNASDVVLLVNAGIRLNDATINITNTTDVQTIVDNAFALLSAGVKKFNFSSGVSVSTSDARTILDAKDLTVEQGITYTDVIFSGEGVLSNLGSASLQSLSDFLAEGLGLDTTFVPEYADALALVQLGITFPQGITLQTSTETTISLSDATTLVNAGVKFQGLFNVSYAKDGSLTETENLTAVSNLISAGLRPVSGDGQKITISGSVSDPLYIRPTEWNALKDYVDLENASLVLTRSSDFLAAFGDLTNNQSFWQTQTQFSKFAVPMSVTPVYSQLKTLADLNTSRSGDGATPISIVRVSKSGDAFTELNTNISIRISSSTDLDAVDAASLKNSGVDVIDVLGVPLTVNQIQSFLSNNAPLLQNAQLLISNDNVSDASALLQQSFDRDIFDAGVSGFGVATGTSTTADVWKVFSDAYDNLAQDSNSATTRIFDGGIITGAGSLTSGVGQVLDRLGRAGLKLSDSYSPSLTEVREYINSGGTYSKGIKIGLQEGETLGPNEAIALAQANVSFTANTPLDFTGQTGSSLTNASTEAEQVIYFQKLLEKGFLLNNLDVDLLNFDGVTVSQDVFELLNSNGFNFSNSKINVANKMELVSAAVKIASTADHGITHLQVPETMVPSFGQAKLLLGAGLGFQMYSSDGTVTNLGATIKAASVSQLESLARQIDSLETMGVSSLDLEGLEIPMNVAKIFAEASGSTNITFLNQPKLLITSEDNLADVSGFLSEIISLGVREITFQNGVEVSAANAYEIIQASDQIVFSDGFITSSEGVEDNQLKTVLSVLKQKGMPVSPGFKPSLDFELTGNDQTDSETMLAMIRDGYKVKTQTQDGGVSEDGERAEITLSNVFMSFREFENLAKTENFGDSSALPKFSQSYVTAKNSQELATIASDLRLEESQILQLGIDNIAIQGNLLPTLTQVGQAAAAGLEFKRVSKTDGEYSILSGSDGLITLKIEQNEIASVAANSEEVFSSGVKRLNFFGKEINVDDAEVLVGSGFSFEGGKLSSSSDPEKNTLSYLEPLADAGLGLPNDVTLRDSTVSLDFALNRFKGSLEGASIDLSSKQGEDAISANQVLRLINRDLGTVPSSNGNKAFVSTDATVPVQIGLTINDDLTSNTASQLGALGFEQVLGDMNVKSSVRLIENSDLIISEAKVKGVGDVDDFLAIINSGNGNLLDGASALSNTPTELSAIKQLITISPDQLDLSGITVAEKNVIPVDFLQIHDRISFSDEARISGHVNSIEQADALITLADIPFDNVLLKQVNEDTLIEAQAGVLVNIVQNGIAVYDTNPTVRIIETGLTVDDALILGSARVDLKGYHLLEGERANILEALQLIQFEGLDVQGLGIERGEELQSTSMQNVDVLRNLGVVFNPLGTEKLFTIDEDSIGPLQAIDYDLLGADLSTKHVDIDGAFVPEAIAIDLLSIDGVDLSNVLTRDENLSPEQIQAMEVRGLRVDQKVIILTKDPNSAENSKFNAQERELEEIDPIGTDAVIVSQGSIFLENDVHSTYGFEITGDADDFSGNLEVEINDTADFSIQKVDWTYSISAEDVEYLAEDETFQENYTIQLSENFVNFVQYDVASLDINIDIVGTDDQPEIIFEDISDVDVLLREGKDFNASGEVLVSERDGSDELAISLQFPQTVIRDDLGQISDSLVDIPIEFTIKSVETGATIWDISPTQTVSGEGESTTYEIQGPQLSAGDYLVEWAIADTQDVFDSLQTGVVLDSDYVLKVSDSGDVVNEENYVRQNISIDFQSNSLPVLVDSNGKVPTLLTVGVEDTTLKLNSDSFGFNNYVDPDGDVFTTVQIVSHSEDIDLVYVEKGDADTTQYSLSSGDLVDLSHFADEVSFVIGASEVNLFVNPGQNINGTRFIDFNIGDGIDVSDTTYRSNLFFDPVADAPIVKTSLSNEMGNTNSRNIKFVGDESTIYFDLLSQGENSEITQAQLSIQQGETVIHTVDFDSNTFETNYEVNLLEIVTAFSESAYGEDESLEYSFTQPLEASIEVEVEDKLDGGQGLDTGTFELVEEITVIPSSTKIKNDSVYTESLFGFTSFDDDGSNSAQSEESDDITFIDPEFGSVISSDDELDGINIEYDASGIIGTPGTDFIFAKSDDVSESGNLIHGLDGFDDITGGEYSDIIYFDFSDDNKHDTVSGGLGDDVFVFHGNGSSNNSESLVLEDTSKQDMTERLENLLTQDSISTEDVTLAGTITDFNLKGEDNSDSIVLSGFSDEAEQTLHNQKDWALLLVEDNTQDKLYTAAILMPEYGTFDSTDMDLMNDAIHKI